ncbi:MULTISPECIES: ABC transporter substrate-binding protein [unclassified Janthinobacterium]|uniref:ABC transporter substrate-binding protein n=1 Tax=unclassified Janthinobacterium TaxID=2610881 RepID=UPI001E55EFA8|nr:MULTISPECIES: ABC transporter substrate-binding protein [unclassified Janthinobacterium]MEC5162639.1 glucose/mannose transport system substrate-binding protein [Janthinobacterium sp. CG_S6]
MIDRLRARAGRGMAWALLGLSLMGAARAESLQVLHWLTSASERKAVNSLVTRLAADNIEWRDAAIPGGAGVGASKVMKSRVLAGNSPEAMQLIGFSLVEWAELGLLLQLDGVAASGNWGAQMYPTAWAQLQNRGHVMAAPLGIHRINTLFYNRKVFNRLGLLPPKTWAEFERVAAQLKQGGVTPLAQSAEAWQVATLFETLVLAEGGPAYYRELFVQMSPAAFADARLLRALTRLKSLKQWMPQPLRERPWSEAARQFADGEAGMFIMGDWVKGELNAWGIATDDGFGCVAVPETANYHLYSIDTLAMFAADYKHQAAQEKLAQVVTAAPAQFEYNQIKGSISVLRGADQSKMDSCARASAQAFGRGAAQQAPSFVHRMATDEASKDAIIAEVQRFFTGDQVSAADTQRRIGAMVQALTKQGKGRGNGT